MTISELELVWYFHARCSTLSMSDFFQMNQQLSHSVPHTPRINVTSYIVYWWNQYIFYLQSCFTSDIAQNNVCTSLTWTKKIRILYESVWILHNIFSSIMWQILLPSGIENSSNPQPCRYAPQKMGTGINMYCKFAFDTCFVLPSGTHPLTRDPKILLPMIV